MRRPTSLTAVAALLMVGGTLTVTAPSAGASPEAGSRPAATTPYVGGTLNVLGAYDVDYLDPNLTYYTVGYMVARAYSRQLYSFPDVAGQTTSTVPDLATGMPVISNGGKTYRITIRSGAMWDTSPARQVTAADVVRGVKITCNPYQPFGGVTDFVFDIKGMARFCSNFAKVGFRRTAIENYLETTPLPGVKAVSDRTVQFTLVHRTSYFTDELTLPALSPRPIEMDKYYPGSAQEAQHTVSDGPYSVTSYSPYRSIVLDRDPAWNAATDPIRHAYVDQIKIHEGGSSTSIQAKLEANQPSADVDFDTEPTYVQAAALERAHDPRLSTGASVTANPYLVFNTVSPNARGALRHVAVRRAISFALNRGRMITSALGGDRFSKPMTHVLPRGIAGSKRFNDYPHDTAKARRLLAASGHKHPTLKLLYRPSSSSSTLLARTVKKELRAVGVTVKFVTASPADFYVKYLERPTAARRGAWDLTFAGWGPDWYGQGADSFFEPLFDGRVLPPLSSNFGLYSSPAVSALIDTASASSNARADRLWAKADRKVMSDAAVYPISSPVTTVFHGAQVHHDVAIPALQQGDYTNMWLSPDAAS